MSNPTDRRYTETHEWAKPDGDVVTVGVTAFAVGQWTEPKFIELPAVGTPVEAAAPFGVIEMSKSTFDLTSPVSGVVVERNEALVDDRAAGRKADLAPVTADPFGGGWLLRVRPTSDDAAGHLLTAAEYDAQLGSESH